MNWSEIYKAMYASMSTVENNMTVRQFEYFAKTVRFQLSHNYNDPSEAGICTECGNDFDFEFHLD